MAEMNLVTIIFNPDKFTELKKALNEIGVTGMTVTHVEGCGVQHGQKTSVGYYRGVATDISLLPKTKIEVVVSEVPVQKVVDTAMEVLKSDEIGAGKIFVSEIKNIWRIRTGEKDVDALK